MAHPDLEARKAIGRIGGLARAARYGPEITARATRAADERFLTEARALAPSGTPESEIVRRAALLRREFYSRLAYKSAEARRKRKAAPFTLEQPGESA